MLPVGHCQFPPPLGPLQAERTVVGSQQRLRCGSIWPVTTGQELVVNHCATRPHSVQISHPRQGPNTQERILSDHPQQSTVLPRCCLWGSPWSLAWHQRSSGSMPFEYAVEGSLVKPTRAAIAPCLMPSRASANTSCLIPIGVGRGIVPTTRKTFEKICKYWFKVVTVWRLIWGNDHLYCGFGARRSHLTLHWMSAQGSVGFRWGIITGPYHANFSQVETQKFDPHWFYFLQWGVTTFLPRVYIGRVPEDIDSNGLSPTQMLYINHQGLWINHTSAMSNWSDILYLNGGCPVKYVPKSTCTCHEKWPEGT